ncbi:UNVERIFIED_CONTAM: hypothetical protein Sangu_0178600 [Sesamum angustifolium]|uniref:Reverse transcriptase domain-containing protein n=1 Tax=Sesamum angustifolium TaxID=2727405 RepID=A0AAW2RML1_9LAMI
MGRFSWRFALDCGRDFNVVLSPNERPGASAPSTVAMSDFHDAIADSALIDAGYQELAHLAIHLELSKLNHCGLLAECTVERKEWNRTVFGNVFDRVAAVERQLKEADEAYDHDPCDCMLVERNRCSAELHNGEYLTNSIAIKNSATSFFQQLLTAEPVFPKEMNSENLEDGLIDEDCDLCFTATTISLILKIASAASWSDYWPISLCNVTNKICTKLMIRLGRVLPNVLSLSQSSFVPGLLSDNVLFAQELIHSLESHQPEANVVFKLDMAKAYDRVSWEFSYQVLRQKGSPQRYIDLVANAVSHCWFSVLVNGMFSSGRGCIGCSESGRLCSGLCYEAVVAVSEQVILTVGIFA